MIACAVTDDKAAGGSWTIVHVHTWHRDKQFGNAATFMEKFKSNACPDRLGVFSGRQVFVFAARFRITVIALKNIFMLVVYCGQDSSEFDAKIPQFVS